MDCFVEICHQSSPLNNIFTNETKEKIKKISNSENSAVEDFLTDFSKDGLKSFLMSASKEVIVEVLKLLPFGGVSKTAFDYFSSKLIGD